MTGLQLHEHVDVAVLLEVIAQYGTEECELPNMVAAPETRDCVRWNRELWC